MSASTSAHSSMDHGAVLGGESLDRLSAMFQSRGLGARAGLGAHPALLIIDMQYGFTDPESSLGAAVDETIAAAGKLAEAARSRSIPVIYTTCVWSEAAAVWARKLPAQRDLVHGSRWVQIDGRIAPQKGDLVLEKNFASAFFGTDLHTRLQTLHIDTLVLTGVTTSGCIRASAVDGCSYGYRVGIAREAVGDRADEPHVMSLFDLDAKYADVMTCDEVNAYLSAPVH